MAMTEYGVNHELAVKLWSKKLFVDALKKAYVGRFMGKTSASLVTIKDETNKSAGDRITVGLRMQLSGDGVQGDNTAEGQEEALTTYDDDLLINQLRHAVRSKGKMSEQRVPFSVRDEARQGLEDWWADRIDQSFFNQVCGYTPQSDTRYSGNNAITAHSTDHKVFVSGSADESLTSAHTFDIAKIDACVERAQTLSPTMRPIKMNGEDKYVMFLHPYQVTDLRTTTTTGQWLDIQKAAMAGMEASKSPIYTGALGEYNGVILHASHRVTQGVNSSSGAAITTVRRAVFCGAQAAIMGYGKDSGGGAMTWVEELFDYKNSLGVLAGMIWGLKKTRFNSLDFSTVTVSSYAAAH